MAQEKKVYDYNAARVERSIVTALKRRNRESTVADIIKETGLPRYQVGESMNRIVYDYAGHLRVTESGEILYYFPDGMRNRNTGLRSRLRRGLRKTAEVVAKVATFLFKIWIMVMLIGYFVLFIALLILAMLVSVAGSASSRDSDRRGGGFGGLFFTTRIIQLFVTLWLYSGVPAGRDYRGGFGPARKKPKGRPLHQSVFAFVFGEDSPTRHWEEREKREFIRFVQSGKGVTTLEEVMHLTGRDRTDAQSLLNELLVEYDGEPGVTEEGVLVYRFPELMKTRELAVAGTEFHREKRPLIPFNTNKSSINKWIGFLNGFNLVFGSYFFIYSYFVTLPAQPHTVLDRFYAIVRLLVGQISPHPVALIAVVLGIVPLAFSFIFYLVPLLRRAAEKRANEKIRADNLRKVVVGDILADPARIDPEEILVGAGNELPAQAGKFVERAIQEVAGDRSVDVEEKTAAGANGPATYVYRIPDLTRELAETEKYRSRISASEYDVGGTVFDSGDGNPPE